jgi:hypothetical protein
VVGTTPPGGGRRAPPRSRPPALVRSPRLSSAIPGPAGSRLRSTRRPHRPPRSRELLETQPPAASGPRRHVTCDHREQVAASCPHHYRPVGGAKLGCHWPRSEIPLRASVGVQRAASVLARSGSASHVRVDRPRPAPGLITACPHSFADASALDKTLWGFWPQRHSPPVAATLTGSWSDAGPQTAD